MSVRGFSFVGSVALSTLLSGSALAQFRPPPPTESALLARDADAERAEAAKREAAGDRAGAATLYGKAAALYEKAMAADPKGSDGAAAAAGFGAATVAGRDYARTVKVLQPYYTAHPDLPDVAFPLGIALFKLNRFNEAVPVLEPLSKANAPEHFMAHYYLGAYGLTAKDGTRAVDELQQYLKKRPQELAAGDAQIEELIGRGYLLQRRAPDARAAFERSAKLRPSTAAQLGIASVLELEGRATEALTLVENLRQRDEKNAELLDRLARMYLSRNQLPRAAQTAAALLQVNRSAPSAMLLGDVQFAQGDWKSAEAAYREAVRLAPKTAPPLVALGRALQKLGRNADLIAVLEPVATESEPAILALLGSAQRRAGQFQKAVEAHQRLLKVQPREVQSHLLLAADYFAVGQWDEAIRSYDAALELDVGNANAKRWLAQALWRRAESRAAAAPQSESVLVDLRRAYDLDRSEPLAQALAAALLAQQKASDAERVLADRVATSVSWQTQMIYAYALLGAERAKEALPLFDRLAAQLKDPDKLSRAELGWALCKLQLGEPEAAAKRLAAQKGLSAQAQANLAVIAVRLAWKKLEEGDATAATRELALVGNQKTPAVELVKAMIAVENKAFAPALAGIKSALGEKQAWFEPATRPVLEAYVSYRMGKLAEARKQIVALQKIGAAKLPFIAKLSRAIDEREAEQLFVANTAAGLPRIEKLLKSSSEEPAGDAKVQSNLAAARYRRGQTAPAVAAWKAVAGKVPEAELNLGLHALQQEKDPKSALGYFRRYAASVGGKAQREWIDRLSALYGDGSSSDGEGAK